jgi:uncharacterized repeat protein (TIGR01451 family)
VGDLAYTVYSPGGIPVTVINRPNCAGGDIEAQLDDDATFPVQDECAFPDPAIAGSLIPNSPLAAFNGALGTGTWRLEVSDGAFDDVGTLVDWSLDLVCQDDADLSVTKVADAEPVIAGTNLTYTVTVNNTGPAVALNVVATEGIPGGTTFVKTDGCNNDPTGVPSCNLGDIPAGTFKTYDVTVSVPSSAKTGAILTNKVAVTSDTNDPDGLNNSFSLDSTVARNATVRINKTQTTANPIVAGQGGAGNLCYNIQVWNLGVSDITGLTVKDTWSPYTGISPSTATSWVINLAAGANTNRSVCFTVASSAPVGTFTDTAAITGSGGGETLSPQPLPTSSVNTAITRVVDIVMSKAESIDPVVAGSGANNLVYTVTARNAGPSDVTNLVVNDAITVPAGVSVGTVTASSGSWTSPNWTVSLAAGASATLTVPITASLNAAEGTDVISDTAKVTGSGGKESFINTGNDSASAATSIRWPQATFNVDKLYAGGTGPGVPVALNCTDASGLGVGAPGNGLTDTALVWRRFDQTSATKCSVVETVPAGYYESQRTADCDIAAVADGGVYNCTLFNQETVARFHVTKDFSDGSTDDVDVTLTCDTGLPLTQTLTIAGGDPTGVTFVVKDFVDGTMSCEVTEVTNTPGYDVDASGCDWDLVNSINSPFSCVVNNAAQDATFTATKIWNVINEGGDVVDQTTQVWIQCNNAITGGSSCGTNCSYITGNLGSGDSLVATVDTTLRSAVCHAYEESQPSSVESTDDCSSRTIKAGESDSCTFTNTVFFEGIPTLSQYGLAILALLMLGVGMVGFRRFV